MRASVAHVVAVVMLATSGCAMISGASDLGIASPGDDTADSGAEGSSPSPGRDGSVPDSSNGGQDAGADAPPEDSGADAPVTTVRCNGVECAGRCCITPEGAGDCAPQGEACPQVTIELSCDEKADCPSGQTCCLAFVGPAPRSACAPACSGGGLETLCGSGQECTGTNECRPLAQIGPPFSSMHGKGACE